MPARFSAIHRALIFRLILAAILLSAILGTTTFLYEGQQLQKQVLGLAQIGIEKFRGEFLRQLDAASEADRKWQNRRVTAGAVRNQPHTDLGRFAIVVVYDASQREVNRAMDDEYPDAQRFFDILARLQPGRSATEIELGDRIAIGNARGLPFALAVADDGGKTIGYVKGVFVPSAKTEADMRRTAWRASVLAIVFVLVTAIFIYPIVRGLIVKLENEAIQLTDANVSTIRVLGSAIAKRDSDTDAHNYRVTLYSLHLAEAVGLDETTIRRLIKGAFLHDIGKIAIRDAILLKPGSLAADEFAEMQNHVRHGLDILQNASWLADAGQVVGCHHEKYDGSGYPNHLVGEAIPITARIFAIADVFDALTSERPYKKAFALDEALAIMRQDAGRHFDPALFAAFEPLVPALFAAIHQGDAALHRMLDETVRYYSRNILKEELEKAADAKRTE